MTKKYLKYLLRQHYKEKSEMPGLIVRGQRRPSYMVMYKLYTEHNFPFIAWYDIEKFLIEEEAQKEEGDTSSTEKASA